MAETQKHKEFVKATFFQILDQHVGDKEGLDEEALVEHYVTHYGRSRKTIQNWLEERNVGQIHRRRGRIYIDGDAGLTIASPGRHIHHGDDEGIGHGSRPRRRGAGHAHSREGKI
jgi:hypothetical protein